MSVTQFVRNYSDLSNDSGFQFEFCCDRCGTGYQTDFVPVAAVNLTHVLEAASDLFGGIFTTAASIGDRVRSAEWEKAQSQAFQKAVSETRPYFNQCRHCASWVDKPCWDERYNLCKECLPDQEAQYSIVQNEVDMEQAQEKVRSGKALSPRKEKASKKETSCTQCSANVSNAKFCPECGTPVKQKTECVACGHPVNHSKFCSECGTQQ